MPEGWTVKKPKDPRMPDYSQPARWEGVPPSSMEEAFKNKLPDNLYVSHYELHHLYRQWSPEEWRTYLRENDKFIQSELSVIAEAQARSALSRLSENQDTSAIRELLSKSKMFADAQGKKETIVFSFIPPVSNRDDMPEPYIERTER